MGITAGVGAIIGGVVGAGSSIAGGIMGSNAAHDAASTQAAAANHAADLQKQAADQALGFSKQQYGNSLNIMAPWINTGQAANSRLSYLMGLTPNQGLPPGVVNPNAPPSGAGNPGVGTDLQSIMQSIRAGNGINGDNGSIGPRPMQANSAMLQSGQNPFGSNGAQNSTFQANPPITSPGTNGTQFNMNPPITSSGTQGGAAGMLGANGQPGADTNPFPNGMGNIGSTNPGQMLGDPSPFGTGGMGNIGSVTQNASGAPGTVGRTDGGGVPLGDPSNPGNIGTVPGGSFGSLAQGWGQTFSSPTAVTEQNDPGYQFRLQQGQKALEASAAARGGLLTGGTAKAINDYAQNSASGEYSNVYNRSLQNYMTNYNTFSNDQANLFNRLSALSGTGQTSAGQLSAAGITTAGNQGNILLGSAGQIGQQINNAGAANASGYVGSANALGGALGGAANSIGGALSLYQLLHAQGGGN